MPTPGQSKDARVSTTNGVRPRGDTAPVRITGPRAKGQFSGGNPTMGGGVNRRTKGRA